MTVAWCVRCRRPAPVDADQLVGPEAGDPSLLPVLPVPEGWLGDSDGDGLVCGDCATPQQISDWMAGAELIEPLVEAMLEDDDDA